MNGSQDLWVTDATAEGTYMVKKINPNGDSDVSNFFVHNNIIYFTANDGVHGKELWKTDGTDAGTQLVVDFYPGPNSGMETKPTVYNNKLIVSARKSQTLTGLWSISLEDINQYELLQNIPYYYDPFFSSIEKNGQLYIVATGRAGTNLWKTNATPQGTIKISVGSIENSIARLPIELFKNEIHFKVDHQFFYATDYVLNGDDTYTPLSTTIPMLQEAIYITKSKESNYLLFRKADNYFVTDGSINGTKQLDNSVNLIVDYSGFAFNFLEYNNAIVMNAENQKNGIELFSYSFDTNKTELLEDLNHGLSSGLYLPTNLNGKLLYFGQNFRSGTELFTSDATPEGTNLLKDLAPNMASTVYSGDDPYLFRHNDKLFFRCSTEEGIEPCVTDGTEAGTRMLKNISRYNQSINKDPFFTKFNDHILLFGADDGANGTASASDLWRTDGTEDGTYLVSKIRLLSGKTAKINNKLYYSGHELNGNQYKYVIAETDATSDATKTYKIIYNEAQNDVMPSIFGAVNNKMIYSYFYSASYGVNSYSKLAVSDGINPNNDIILGEFLEIVYLYNDTHNNRLFFHAKKRTDEKSALYVTDGTLEGTKIFSNLFNYAHVANLEFTKCGNYHYIKLGNQIYTLDNNDKLEKLLDGGQDARFQDFKCYKNNLFFADHKYTDNAIWVTNAATQTTQRLNFFIDNTPIQNLIYLGSFDFTDKHLFFSAYLHQIPEYRKSGTEVFVADVSDLNLNTMDVDVFKDNKSKMFSIYPNPTQDNINIVSRTNAIATTATLIGYDGRPILYEHNKVLSKISISNIPSGNYLLIIETANREKETHKIIKN